MLPDLRLIGPDEGHMDMLAIYERQADAERAKFCPVCGVPYDDDLKRRYQSRTISVMTGPDTRDVYPCPGCRPNEYPEVARRHGDSEYAIKRMLERAARDVAAGRRL